MAMSQGDGWVAVLRGAATTGAQSEITAPVVYWKECGDATEGWIVKDAYGLDLPYPVPAPNVTGFLRYAKP